VVGAGSRPALMRRLRRLPWSTLATGSGLLVGLAGFFAWFVRPRVQHTRGGVVGLVGGLQNAEHVSFDPTRNYFEQSLRWMSWYLGPLTLTVAIVAAGLLLRELMLGRMARVIGALAVLAPGTVLYLVQADAVPDHPWVTRRFLVGAFPVLILLALGLAAAGASVGANARGRGRVARRVAAVVFALCAVAYPIHTLAGVSAMTEQRGFLAVVTEACSDLGPRAAVVVLERDKSDLFDDWTPQALRSWCGAEVAVSRGPAHADALRALARSWNARGRRLFVVALSSDQIAKTLPGAAITPTREAVNTKFLRQSLTHRPDAYSRQTLTMALAPVPTG
jgi:hypothetical protein